MASPVNEEEIQALEKFWSTTKFNKLGKKVLMRYLRARDLDVDKAEEALETALVWKENFVNKHNLQEWKIPDDFRLTFQTHFLGIDSEDRIVIYVKFDDWLPIRPLFETYKLEEMVLFAYQVIQKLHTRIATSKHQQVIAIWNNMDIGFSKVFYEVQNWTGVQTLRQVLQMMDLNYPETLYKAFFVNTNRAFVWGFNLVKPFLREYTLAKISMMGPDETVWKPELAKYLPDHLIPEALGGSASLGDSMYDFVYDDSHPKHQYFSSLQIKMSTE